MLIRYSIKLHITTMNHTPRPAPSSSPGHSVRQFIQACRKVTRADVATTVHDARPGDAAVVFADARRVRERLGWQPVHESLEEMLSTSWKWSELHANGYAEHDLHQIPDHVRVIVA